MSTFIVSIEEASQQAEIALSLDIHSSECNMVLSEIGSVVLLQPAVPCGSAG